MNRSPSLLAVAVLLGAAVLVAHAPEAEAATTRALTISTASAHPAQPFARFDGHPPKLFDLDGDGDKEIVVHNENRHVYVLDGRDGRILADLTTRYPSGWGARPLNGAEAAVLEPGGRPHVVVANSAAYVTAFRHDGGFSFTKVWETRLDRCGEPNPGMDSKPVLADLDGDGRLEVLAYTEEVGGYALRPHDGSILWQTCIGGGNSAPAVADMDFDGRPEVVWASDAGVVTVSDAGGRTEWTFWAGDPRFDLGAASIVVGASVGQIDGTGPLDVAFGARDSHDHETLSNNHAALFAVNGWGGLMWMRQDKNGGAPLTHTLPVIHDVDGDGQKDVLWADWNTMGHKPPPPDSPDAFKRTGPAHFYRYDADGQLRWKTTLETYWNNKDLVLADVDGDGVQEVLANGPGSGGDGIWYLDSRTGAKEAFVSTHPWKVSRAPVAADLWGTGTMQWVVQVEAADGSVSGGAVQVHDTHVRYDAAWPGPPGPHTGSGGGSPPPPPPSGGTFDATFTIKSPNEWWQEVTVKPDSARTVTDVQVRVDGGTWKTMGKSSWGAWTSSHHAPAGSSVEFQARDAGGATSTSAPFTWLDGTTSKRSTTDGGGGGGGGTFEATFTVPDNVNEWWVEVRVDSAQTVTKVTATVDGSPQTLSRTDWGTWAKSFHAPAGSQVRFTATSATGATDASQTYSWLGAPPSDGGDMAATFSVPGTVNEWWVEVKVSSDRPVTGVSAIVDGGSPRALSKTGWGTWAKSFHVPAGSEVVFRATDGSDTVDSKTFAWLGGGSGGSGGAFDATFTVSDTTNNWWVEASVEANEPVTKVEARVDGGAWRDLPRTDWGTWAESFHVPAGSRVEFRAHGGGATDVSGAYIWS